MSSPVAFAVGEGSIAIQIGRSSNKDRRRAGHLAVQRGHALKRVPLVGGKTPAGRSPSGCPASTSPRRCSPSEPWGRGHAFAPSWLSGVCVSSVLSRSVRPYRS